MKIVEKYYKYTFKLTIQPKLELKPYRELLFTLQFFHF